MNTLKEKLSVITCLLAFFFGFGLTIGGFIVPPTGEISDSVLWVLGQSLLYCGAILGISNHYDDKLRRIEQGIDSRIKHDIEQRQHEKKSDA